MMIKSKSIVNGWGWFHIGFILFICAYSAYHKSHSYYGSKENKLIARVSGALLTNVPVVFYGRLSGTGAGYGFFAPQIKSQGLILGDCNGKKLGPNFANFETMMRFNVMASRVTDYLITKDDGSPIMDSVMKSKFYNLVFKSIAVKVYNQNQCWRDTLFMSYNIVTFPTLQQYREGRHDYQLLKIKEVRIVKQTE